MYKSVLIGALALSMGVAGWTSCVEDEIDADYSKTINIIAAFPNTGAFAERGERYLKTLQMAVHDLEAGGDLIDGRKILIHPFDATNDKAVAKEKTEALIEKLGAENVAVIMSGTGAVHKATVEVAIAEKIPHFEWTSGGRDDEFFDLTEVTNADKHSVFQVRGLCPGLASMAATAMYELDYKKVGLMRGTTDHDITHTTIIRADLGKYAEGNSPWDGVVMNDEDFVMQYESDITWGEYLDQYMVQNPDTDVIFYHLRGDTVNFAFLKAVKERSESGQPTPTIMTCDMARKPALLDPVATNVADYLAIPGNFYFIGRGPLTSDIAEAFDADLGARYNVLSDRWTKTGYDAMILAGLAIASVQSTEHAVVTEAIYASSKDGQKVGYPNIQTALSAAKAGTDIDYDGVSGNMDIREANGTTVPEEFDRTVEARYYVEDIVSDGSEGYQYHVVDSPGAVVQ